MELDNIKLQTTWNDAAGSINSNFQKIKQAIAALELEGGGLDEEQLAAYLVANGYTTQQWVEAQGYLKENDIDLELLEGYMPMSRDFSDDFNNDFAR